MLNLLDSDFLVINERLATHYGIDGVKGEDFRRVPVRPEHRRGGIVGMAGPLTYLADGTRTLPVRRGAYLLDVLWNTPAALPPPNAGDLPVVKGKNLTVRQRLEQHRSVTFCASCHSKIDPLGLALENYDAIGAWRERQNGEGRKGGKGDPPIDPSGVMPPGRRSRPCPSSRACCWEKKRSSSRASRKNCWRTRSAGRSGRRIAGWWTRSSPQAAKDEYRLQATAAGHRGHAGVSEQMTTRNPLPLGLGRAFGVRRLTPLWVSSLKVCCRHGRGKRQTKAVSSHRTPKGPSPDCFGERVVRQPERSRNEYPPQTVGDGSADAAVRTGVAIALPWLEAMGMHATSYSKAGELAASEVPARAVFTCWGMGMNPFTATPEKTGLDYDLPVSLKPLEPFRKETTYFTGLHAVVGGHQSSHCFLTGVDPHKGKYGISCDQLIAESVGRQDALPAAGPELHPANGVWRRRRRHSVLDRNRTPVLPRRIDRRCCSTACSGPTARPRRPPARRTPPSKEASSIRCANEARRLEGRLGKADRARLEEYLASIREVEQQLAVDAHWLAQPKPKVDPGTTPRPGWAGSARCSTWRRWRCKPTARACSATWCAIRSTAVPSTIENGACPGTCTRSRTTPATRTS